MGHNYNWATKNNYGREAAARQPFYWTPAGNYVREAAAAKCKDNLDYGREAVVFVFLNLEKTGSNKLWFTFGQLETGNWKLETGNWKQLRPRSGLLLKFKQLQ